MGSARNGGHSTAFPPGKSPDEIALILAELGEELGVWSKDLGGVVPEMVPPAADAKRQPGKRRPTTPPQAPRRTTPPPLARASAPSSFEHEVDFTSLHGTKPLDEPREESVLELAPEEIVELADGDVDDDYDDYDDYDDALDPLEVSFIEFLDQATDEGEFDDLETIEPVLLDRPRATAAYPPVPRRARPVSRITWTLRDETTATDMFVA